jgi:hypothetical protein
LTRSAQFAVGLKFVAGTSSYEEVVARFAQQLLQIFAGTITTGSVALERGVRPMLSLVPSRPVAWSASVEEEQRLDAARAEWAQAFSARVETMRAILNSDRAVDAPTPIIPGDE